jgi:hypothetical protein
MIKITNIDLDKLANEHYQAIKEKLKDFPEDYEYSLEDIILAKPNKLDEIVQWANNFSYNFKFIEIAYNNFIKKKKEYDAYDLAKKLNINTCPYCNMNSTYTIIKKDNVKIIRPEFDHFYDKATNPILALSFYNLIPSCHICNSTLKGTDKFTSKTHINPYESAINSKFKLEISDSTFYNSTDGFNIRFKSDNIKENNNIKSFKLNTLYQNHKDIVLELIQKEVIYNDSYLDELMTNYEGTLFKNKEDLQRLITGGYISDIDLGKRPLSKLIKDISEELELI